MKKILVLLIILVFVLVGCSSVEEGPVSLTIDLAEFSYSPEVLELKVGQTVTITINNVGNLQHEIMFGRNMMLNDDGSAMGYDVDMFEFAGVEPAGMMNMGAEDEDHDEGEEDHDEEGMDMDGMDMDGDEDGMDMDGMDMEDEHEMHSGFMTTIDSKGGTTTITFTVTEEMVGEWEFGCFLDQGTHYAAGMSGKLVVTN